MESWSTTASGMMDADCFERNTLIEGMQQGICGNVAGNGVTGDVILLSNYVGYHGYSLSCTKGGDIEKLRKTATTMHRKAQPAGQCINNACDLVSANP